MVEATEELILAGREEVERAGERLGGGDELTPLQMRLCLPADRAQTCRLGRPLIIAYRVRGSPGLERTDSMI